MVQAIAIRSRAVETEECSTSTGNPVCFLPRRHLRSSQIEGGAEEAYHTLGGSFDKTGIYYQLEKERFGAETSATVPRFSIRYSEDDNQGAQGQDEEAGDQNTTNYSLAVG